MPELGSILIKPDQNRDFYVLWDRSSETPIFWGSRRKIIRTAKKYGYSGQLEDSLQRRLGLADIYSFSSANRGYSWSDECYIPYSIYGVIYRKDLRKFIKAVKRYGEFSETTKSFIKPHPNT